MSENSKALRGAALSLAILFILAATMFFEQRSIKKDLFHVEQSYIAHALLSLPAELAKPADNQPIYDGPHRATPRCLGGEHGRQCFW